MLDECVVKGFTTCRYLALSYKLGGVSVLQAKTQTISDLQKPGSLRRLRDSLSNTVRDAMDLTKDIGQRYLWVDQLCTIQDDLAKKQAAINSMSGVYAFAFLTIIAADGNDAHAGLRGYGSRPRGCEQMAYEIGSGLKLLLVPDLVEILAALPYESRAWT